MRVCIVHEYFKPYVTGGADIFLNNLADYLVKKGWEVDVITTLQDGLKKKEKLDGINIHRFVSSPFKKKHRYQYTGVTIPWNYFNFSLIKQMKKIMEKSDVIVLNNIFHLSLSPIIAAKLLKKPVVFDIHDYWPFCFKKDLLYNDKEICTKKDLVKCGKCLLARYPKLKFMLPFYIPLLWMDNALRNFFLNSSFDRIVVHSNFMAKKAKKLKKPIEVIPYPYIEKIHKRKRTLSKQIRILYIGRLISQKGAHFIPEISRRLKRMGVDFKFDVIGPGPLLEKLKTELKQFKNVKIHGPIYDEKIKTKFFLNSDVLLISSRSEEPFGIVTLEGMAHGLPIVSTNMGGLGEVVTENDVGLTCKPTAKDFAETIQKLISDKKNYKKFSMNGYKNIKKYDKKKIFKRYENVLREIKS